MDINILRSPIKFGRYLKGLTTKEFCELSGAEIPTVLEMQNGFFRVDAVRLRIRDDYDSFLMKTITKNMIINPVPKPELQREAENGRKLTFNELRTKEMYDWRMAERNVVFTNVDIIENDKFFSVILDSKYQLTYNKTPEKEFFTLHFLDDKNKKCEYIDTLYDLSIKTDMDINIKKIL